MYVPPAAKIQIAALCPQSLNTYLCHIILKVSDDSSPVQHKCLFLAVELGEIFQTNFGLQKFKIGECLFSCFEQGKYLLRRADDSSYSVHKYNTRARNTQRFLTVDQQQTNILFCALCFCSGVLKNRPSEISRWAPSHIYEQRNTFTCA